MHVGCFQNGIGSSHIICIITMYRCCTLACTLGFAGFSVHGFCGSQPSTLDISGNARCNGWPSSDIIYKNGEDKFMLSAKSIL